MLLIEGENLEMNFIIFDLEWNPVYRNRELVVQEITEIGAVEVSIVDDMVFIGRQFHSYVRPTNPISKKIKKLTNLQAPDTWLAPKFPIVEKQFRQWLGNQSYIYCSWGSGDRNVLISNLSYHKLKIDPYKQYFNIQSAVSKLAENNNGNQIGLVKGLEILGLSFEGSPHSAIDDAYNTARIFTKVYNQLTIEPEPFVANQLIESEYRKQVEKLSQLRKTLGLTYHELSILSNMNEEELEQIELFQITKSKKEITRLLNMMYAIGGTKLGKNWTQKRGEG
jgi:inhibitor of KinA sporulation pathway (predicted exonuclease)